MSTENEKSQIDSFNVSLGSLSGSQPASRQLERWNILVCSDLGFVSKKPQPVRISGWNEFMESQNVVLSGAVENKASGEDKPLFFEYSVRSLTDFSVESIMANAMPLSAMHRVCYALEQFVNGKTSREDAVSMIGKAGLGTDELGRVLRLLEKRSSSPAAMPRPRPPASSVDRILSMVDAKQSLGKDETEQAAGLTDALFTSVVEPQEFVDKAGISAYISRCGEQLRDLTATVEAQPFFASRKSSWTCLNTLAKVIGRKKEVSVSVFSAPQQDLPDRLHEALSVCLETGVSPDVIVWDFDVSFANADMDIMATVAAAAEQYKCMVIAPLSASDPLFAGISGRESVSHIFEEVRFLPYKKLRDNTSTRCLCLCGSQLAQGGGRSCWYAAIRWAEMLNGALDPFAVRRRQGPLESVFLGVPLFSETVCVAVTGQASDMGITLFEETLEKAGIDKIATVVGPDNVAAHYTSFAFNLLVNRAVRLSGIKILSLGAQKNKDEVATVLEGFLENEMQACGIAVFGKTVSVTVENSVSLVIEVNSDVMVSGYPACFSFSI
jgi:hypothetical protein